jgi:hypothetical protein
MAPGANGGLLDRSSKVEVCLGGSEVLAEPPGPLAPVPKWRIRLVVLVGAALLVLGLGAVVAGFASLLVVDDTARFIGVPIGLGSWPGFKLGWRMVVRPEEPWP